MKTYFLNLVAIVVMVVFAGSCKKDDDSGAGQHSRKVKYELSGNYSGKLLVVTSTSSGQIEQFTNIAIPWNKELEYDKAVTGVSMGFQTASTSTLGVPGQTLTVKVYLNGTLKDTKNVTADVNGAITAAMSYYTF